jgi:RND superfamily putative drug exporter
MPDSSPQRTLDPTLLVVFALPTFGIKLGIDLGLSAVSDTPSGKGELVLARSFSPGVLSPVQILASHQGSGELSAKDLSTIDRFTTSLLKDPRVVQVYSISQLLRQTQGEVSPQALARLEQDPTLKPLVAPTVNVGDGSNRTIITVVTRAAIDSTEATELVEDLRADIIPSYTASGGPEMLVGGATAQFSDLAEETLDKLPVVLTLVLSFSFVYLLVIFRSVLLPAKAVLMNLLATAAAFGLTTWVFLIGRMREEWLRTHDNDEAVATGVAHTARPITAAALIMAAVFGCFLVADVLELKEFGFALAVAVILDATLVRMLLVPAFMKVAGDANWWLPGPLKRRLPELRLD